MSDPWFKFYASDWLAGTRGLTAAETGVYVTLIAMMYERGEDIPRDDVRLSRLCGCPKASFTRSLNALIDEGKVTEIGGGLSNDRVEKERQCRVEKSQKASVSASKRWASQADKSEPIQQKTDANAVNSQCDLDANQIPEPYREVEAKASLSLVAPIDAYDPIPEAIQLFKEAAEKSGWPIPRVLSKARKAALSARLKECDGIDGWKVAIDKAQASPHCCGDNDRNWVLTFDFITNQSSFTKLMEGNYDNRDNNTAHNGSQHGGGRGGVGSGTADAFAAVAARLQAEQGRG